MNSKLKRYYGKRIASWVGQNYNNFITNSNSIVKLNNAPSELECSNDSKMVEKMNNFYTNFTEFTHVETLDINLKSLYYKDLNDTNRQTKEMDGFSFDLVEIKKIYDLIKCDKIEICKNANEFAYMQFIARCENTETKEIAFLLPCKKF